LGAFHFSRLTIPEPRLGLPPAELSGLRSLFHFLVRSHEGTPSSCDESSWRRRGSLLERFSHHPGSLLSGVGPRGDRACRPGAQTERQGGAGPAGACLAVSTPSATYFVFAFNSASSVLKSSRLRNGPRSLSLSTCAASWWPLATAWRSIFMASS